MCFFGRIGTEKGKTCLLNEISVKTSIGVIIEDNHVVNGWDKWTYKSTGRENTYSVQELLHSYCLHASPRCIRSNLGASASHLRRYVVPLSRIVCKRITKAGCRARLFYEASHDRISNPGVGVQIYRGSTCRLPIYGDARWVAPECCNVVTNPFDGKTLVEETGVLFEAW